MVVETKNTKKKNVNRDFPFDCLPTASFSGVLTPLHIDAISFHRLTISIFRSHIIAAVRTTRISWLERAIHEGGLRRTHEFDVGIEAAKER